MKPVLMLSTILILLFLISVKNAEAQAPGWEWALRFGGYNSDNVYASTIDNEGNIIMVGGFGSSILSFGQSVTSLSNASNNLYFDVFVVKFNPAGYPLWAHSAGGLNTDRAVTVTTDQTGNVIIGGSFRSPSISFDGSWTLTNQGLQTGYGSMFFVKYDQFGNVVWAKAGTNPGDGITEVRSCTTDANGNLFVAGTFSGSSITFDSYTLTNTISLGNQSFIVKYDGSGNALWATSVQGQYNNDIMSLATDPSGNLIAAGSFDSPSLQVQSFTLNNPSQTNKVFVLKYDAAGNALWAKGCSGPYQRISNGLDCDSSGNIILGGHYNGTITLDTFSVTTVGVQDIFITKLDGDGTVLWLKSAGGANSEYLNDVEVDSNGDILIVGNFNSASCTFGSNTVYNSYVPYTDPFLSKYDTEGNALWAQSFGAAGGGLNNDDAVAVMSDALGHIYLSGTYGSSFIEFGATMLTNSLSPNTTMFLAKAGQCSSYFTIYPDAFVAHTWILQNETNGVGPFGYTWSWGDGTTSTGIVPSHTYAAPGNYQICVTIDDVEGCSSTYCDSSTYLARMDADMVTVNVIDAFTTGITAPETIARNISATPSLFNNNISVNGTATSGLIIIYDILGKEIKVINATEDETIINTQNLLPGFYVLHYFEKQFIKNIKVVKE